MEATARIHLFQLWRSVMIDVDFTTKNYPQTTIKHHLIGVSASLPSATTELAPLPRCAIFDMTQYGFPATTG
jgi:hypothetical protein